MLTKVKTKVKTTYEYNKGYVIPKSQLTVEEKANVIKILTVTPEGNNDFTPKNDPSFAVFREDKENYYVPKYWGMDTFGTRFLQPIEQKNSQVNFNFNGKLRGSQPEVIEHILNKLETNKGGILQLHTGYGKTTAAIYIASVLKLKTLVLVHKTFLQNQWYERIKQFTDANIGMIRQKNIDIEGKDIIIGMLQSISMIDYDPEIFKDIDLLIVDECFPYDTLISTNMGFNTMEELYELWENKKELPLIKSYNEQNKCFEFKKMTYAWKKQTEKLVRVMFNDGTIDCTPNHKFLTIDGYKAANKLTTDDILLGLFNNRGLNDDQLQIIFGSFLGNGEVNCIKNNEYEFVISYDITQHKYWEWKVSMLDAKLNNDSYSIKFDINKKFPQNNTCPQWIIDEIDFRGIAIWIMDKCIINEKSLCTTILTSFDEDTNKRLVDKLVSLGINCNLCCNLCNSYININEDSTQKLLSYIKQYVHDSVHKFNCEKYKWNDAYLDYDTCSVDSVSNINVDENNKNVYDIEVEDNHNFIVSKGCNDLIGPIVHNCHHIASKVFSRALFKLNPKHTLALSATPNRPDGLTKVMHWYLGDTIVKVERKCDNVVYVKSFEYESTDLLFAEKKKWISGVSKPDTIKMTTNMCNINSRNVFIMKIIDSLRFIDERKILVLSKRVAHLHVLKTMMDKIIGEEIKNGKFCEGEFTTSYYIGGMREWQLNAAAEADIIFATYSMAEEGLDIDGLNTLVLANSIKNPVQAIGRILRKPIESGDINPLVIDIGDNLSFFSNWSKDRIKYYKTNKYIMDYRKVHNENIVSIYDYLIKNKVMVKGDYDTDTLRKLYIEHKWGKSAYTFEKKLKFRNYPDSMFENTEFNSVEDYKKLFEINCDFENLDINQGSIIDYNPITKK